MPIVGYSLIAVIAYLLGSIPTGFLVAKAKGIDIRSVGSGNIGATNVFRMLGTTAGIIVLLSDALKGWIAVAIISPFLCDLLGVRGAQPQEAAAIVAGFAVILGHNYTCWLHFKGGKGIATSAGVLVALVPYALLIILAVWIVMFALTRYVSVGSIAASLALPVAVWITGKSSTLIVITSAMTALAVYKHKSNIQRLLNGTESRIDFRKRTRLAEAGKPSK